MAAKKFDARGKLLFFLDEIFIFLYWMKRGKILGKGENWIICKNGYFRYRENLQNKKTADSVLLSLFIKINGKCNNSHAPSTGLSGIPLSVQTQYSWRTRIWKIPTLYRCTGRSFTNSTRHNDSCCDLLIIWKKRILTEVRDEKAPTVGL